MPNHKISYLKAKKRWFQDFILSAAMTIDLCYLALGKTKDTRLIGCGFSKFSDFQGLTRLIALTPRGNIRALDRVVD
jgi:hypothetical protein